MASVRESQSDLIYPLNNIVIVSTESMIEEMPTALAWSRLGLSSERALRDRLKKSELWRRACYKVGTDIKVVPHLVMEVQRELRDHTQWD